MNLTPTVLSTLAALAGLGLASAAGLALRSRAVRRPAPGGADHRLDALAARVAALEARGPSPSPAPASAPKASAAERRVDRPGPAGPTLIAVPDLSAPAAPGPGPGPAADLGRRFAAIWEGAEAGASAEAIARRTGRPVGQVELILGLKRRASAPGGPRPT